MVLNDDDDPEWVALNQRLTGSDVPFKATRERVRQRSIDNGEDPAMFGQWVLRWPGSTHAHPTAIVVLYGSEADAIQGFAQSVGIAGHMLSPRGSMEVRRNGCAMVRMLEDHWNEDADAWLEIVRALFDDADERWVP